MKAIEIKKKYVKEDMFDKVGVIAISQSKEKQFWYHVHEDEKIPEKDYDIAIHIRS